MQNLSLEILANKGLYGNKYSNIFKHASYAKVAKAITEKFMTKCTPKQVEQYFKTLKTIWNALALLRNKKSGFGWNDNLKMITCDRTMYDKEVVVRNFYFLYFTGRNFLGWFILKFKSFHYSYCSHISFWLFSFFYKLFLFLTSQSCTVSKQKNWDVWWDGFGCG